MGASVRPIPASLRDAIARAVAPQSTQMGMGRPVAPSAPFASLPVSRMGPAMPGALPLPLGRTPVQANDLTTIANPILHALYVGSGMQAGADAGRALSAGRGFDRLGGKQPIAGPLLTAALTAAPLATGEAGPMVRAIGDEATAGVKALAPEFTSAVSDALSRARINDLNAQDILRSALREQNTPLGPMEIRTSARSAAPGQGYVPSRTVPPDAAALQQMEIPTTARRSVAQAVMDSVATMPLRGTKVVDEAGNPRTVYHGTSQVFPSYDMSRMEPTGMYGPGIYHTESPAVAGGTGAGDRTGYAFARFTRPDYEAKVARLRAYLDNDLSKTARQRAEADLADAEYLLNNRAAEAPNVRPARLAIKNPFDVDRTLSPDELLRIADAADHSLGSGAANVIRRTVRDESRMEGQQVYQTLLDHGASKQDVNGVLRNAGFDGITHIGGANTGTAPHRVWIAFDPSQVRSAFDPIESARQVGGFVPPIAAALTAGPRKSSTH